MLLLQKSPKLLNKKKDKKLHIKYINYIKTYRADNEIL